MAAVSDPKGGFKQDMVVSIRYRNDLPPPPMPPKLLDIDNGGLAQYLTTSFAAAMARREEPNIEIDAEGGMPIDMVGIPGYFLGDESAIMAPEIQPVLDPADHALLLTPEQLRNQDSKNTNVSFLRRTQYMTSQNARANDPLIRPSPRATKSMNKSAPTPESFTRDDKENIRRHLQKGFEIANPDSISHSNQSVKSQPPTAAEREAWRNPVHPENPNLKPVAYFPVLPELDASAQGGTFMSVKFDKPPLPAIQGRRDDRVDVGFLQTEEIKFLMPAYNLKKAAFEKNPELYDDPGDAPFGWAFHVPKEEGTASRVRRVLNDADPQRDDPTLYEGLAEERSKDGALSVDYPRVKTYTHYEKVEESPEKYMAISLFDPELSANSNRPFQGRAAFYYPLDSRLRLRTDRGKAGYTQQSSNQNLGSEERFDGLSLKFKEPGAAEKFASVYYRGLVDSSFQDEFAEIRRLAEAEEEANQANELESVHEPLLGGEQDVTMAEVELGEDIDLITNGTRHQDGDSEQEGVSRKGNADAMEAE